MIYSRFTAMAAFALLLVSCATTPKNITNAKLREANMSLRSARCRFHPVQERAADYVQAAVLSADLIGSKSTSPVPTATSISSKARRIYNSSSAELTQLLRTGENGQYWNRPLTLTTGQGTYYLSTQPKVTQAFWSPNYFTDYIPIDQLHRAPLRKPNLQEGIGGALVGVYHPEVREPFAPKLGVAAPVTSSLEFKGNRAVLVLHDPVKTPRAKVLGKEQTLQADLSASLELHPPVNELWRGFTAMIRIEKYMSTTGLFFLEPYDPNKIPLIFVHGLMSTGHMWRNVANEVQSDQELHRRYQVWVFSYPSGNPVSYSALRLREELAKVERLYAPKQGYVLVGHSMGGLLSRMQATDTGRVIWDVNWKESADRMYAKLPADHLLKRMLIFRSNPNVKRIIFVCVPHRGSELALSSIGALGRKLISLPASFTETIQASVQDGLSLVLGSQHVPTSIDSLSPKNPTLMAMDGLRIQAPHHSVIGDRGKGDSPNSSDGVVPYWSSHLQSAQSELIVPGSHGAFELPRTVSEIQRILRAHLKNIDRLQRQGTN